MDAIKNPITQPQKPVQVIREALKRKPKKPKKK